MNMKHKEPTVHHLPSLISAALAFGVMTSTATAGMAESMGTQDHAMHQMQHHGAMMGASMEDHSQHMQAMKAMQQQKYQRSVGTYSLPAMELTDMHGDAVNIDELLDTDQPLVVNFIFTSCTTICPIMSATFSQAQKKLGDDAKPVRWVSISIDPEYDTPARLREYADRFHAKENWHFITGNLERIIQLQKAFHVYNGSKMNHKPVTLLRAGRGQPWVRLEGLTSGSELVAEYRQIAQ